MNRAGILVLALLLTACSYSSQKASIESTTKDVAQTKSPEPQANVVVEKAHIVKFFDYACGHCRDAHFTVKKLTEQFGDKVEFELKHFPLSAETYLVAETAECARRQGKFEAYHNELMERNFRQYTPENLQAVATMALLNLDEFNTCAANGGGKSAVQEDVDEATAMGVTGTPYFLINDSIPLPGAIPEKSFARLIQQVLDGEVR